MEEEQYIGLSGKSGCVCAQKNASFPENLIFGREVLGQMTGMWVHQGSKNSGQGPTDGLEAPGTEGVAEAWREKGIFIYWTGWDWIKETEDSLRGGWKTRRTGGMKMEEVPCLKGHRSAEVTLEPELPVLCLLAMVGH